MKIFFAELKQIDGIMKAVIFPLQCIWKVFRNFQAVYIFLCLRLKINLIEIFYTKYNGKTKFLFTLLKIKKQELSADI